MTERDTEFDNRQPEDCAPAGEPNCILDVSRPFWELGDQPRGHADLVRQDGYIYGWSDSNIRYELLGRATTDTPPGRYYSKTGLRAAPAPASTEAPDYTSITRSIAGGR